MAIKYERMYPVKAHYRCDECGNGNLCFSGLVLDSYPPIFVHSCSGCGGRFNLDEKYPSPRFLTEDEMTAYHTACNREAAEKEAQNPSPTPVP